MSPKRRRKEDDVIQVQLVNLYLIFMLLIFPLFYRNNYIDILEAKRDLFLYGTVIFFVLTGSVCLYQWMQKEMKCIETKSFARGCRYLPRFLGLCVLSWIVGMLMCDYKSDAFWGLTGRFLGISSMICALLAMLVIGRYLEWNVIMTWSFLGGSAIVYLLQILNEWKIDPLNMKDNLLEREHATFASTIGNINFNASFDGVVLAVGMVLFLLCREKISGIVYGSWLFLGFVAAFSCRSDSVFLGIMAAFLVLFWHVLGNGKRMIRFWLELFIFFLSSCVFKALYEIFAKHCYSIDGVAELLQNEKILCAELLFLVFFGIWILRKKEDWTSNKRVAQKMYVCVIVVATIGGIGLLLLANIGTMSADGFSRFRITDAWGSYRGYIWKKACELYGAYPISKKLFGCGMNCLPYLLEQEYAQEMKLLTGSRYLDVHNEFLQILLTTGIIGMIGYFGMIFSILKSCINKIKENEQLLLGIAGIAAFLAQGIVNNSQIVTMPVFFVSWGIYLGMLRKTKNAE